MKLVNRKAKTNLILSRFVFCAIIVFLYSCGSGGSEDDSSTGTGSVSFGIALQDRGTVQALESRALDNSESQFECQTYEIATIEAQVVDEDDELLTEGGPWDCEDRQGTIDDVEAGDGRIVKVSIKISSGIVIFAGKSGSLTVEGGKTTEAGTITLNRVEVAPVANDDPDGRTSEDTSVTIDVLSNDTDANGDALIVKEVTRPENGKATTGGASVTYDPDTNFNGKDSFTYTVSDGSETDTATVTVTVTPVNDPPIANDDEYETFKSTLLDVPPPGVLGNDTDPDNDALEVVLSSNVSNGTLELKSDGSFTYAPDPLFVGEDTFTYMATDGSLTSSEATVTIAVLATGEELWMSDGTAAGTVLIKDIHPGPEGSSPTNLTAVNDTLFFLGGSDRVTGGELWISDGTERGTLMVKDINPEGPSIPVGLTDVNGTLFFWADDGKIGWELWMSDGTAAGTVLIKDIHPGPEGSFPWNHYATAVNSTLFFRVNDGLTVGELWMSDGTEQGTLMVKDINPEGSSSPGGLTDVNGTLFFWADDGKNGRELWMSDGTEQGTLMVKDINPEGSSSPGGLTDVNGILFFTADDGLTVGELWMSDGTEQGTLMVKDINPEGSSSPGGLTDVNGTLFFNADDGKNGRELWMSDGTKKGTLMVKDINPEGNSFPRDLTDVNGILFFTADDGLTGRELWMSDGTEQGTLMVKDINPEGSSGLGDLTDVNGTLFFSAWAAVGDLELWMSDGTEEGTMLVKIIRPAPDACWLHGLTNVNGTLFFTEFSGCEL